LKLALIGYGAMGKLVEKLAGEQGHEIFAILTSADTNQSADELASKLRACDVAIDFSIGSAVPRNVEICVEARVPLVEGTTGWDAKLDEVRTAVTKHDGALIYGANFSVGVQVYYRIAARAAELFRDLESYDPFIEEEHHKRKLDAPSGTAAQLRKRVAAALGKDVPVTSTRAGYIPGTHRLGFDSASDQIMLTHTARSREGFAAGALVAAKWIIGRKGVFEFSEVFDEIVTPQRHRDTEK
jgi:4-hydroxy-tetrahydrodipicolinate reductase